MSGGGTGDTGGTGPGTDPMAVTAVGKRVADPPSSPQRTDPPAGDRQRLFDTDPNAATELGGSEPPAAWPTPAPARSEDFDPAGPTAAESGPDGRASLLVVRAEKIDRFVVVAKLGEGGMGVVVAAFDPKLDRKVAIKMLHDGVSEAHGARLEREAKAMAQLSHPNVVTVHETGTFEGRIYIAMEFVDGVTLGRWLRDQPRTRDQILDIYIQAGRGLAAAHDVGLVHRDFKPDNVLIGKDGRPRVSDFGLVSAVGEAASGAAASGDGERPSGPLTRSSLTVTGAVMGTPLYMAPEQHGGRIADAKADQFSYCVALWQALCDDAPYGADSYEDLVANVTGGKLKPVPRGARVPAELRAILVRGLSASADARFPSMTALLVALERTRRPRRWPWIAAASVVVLGGGTAAVLVARGGDRDPCSGGEQRLGGAWSRERSAAIARAFEPLGTRGADVAQRVGAALDVYAKRWVTAHRTTCEATRVRGEQTTELLDLRMRCLDRLRTGLGALVDRFEAPTRGMLDQAVDAAGGLDPVSACDDVAQLRAAIPLPADPAVRVRIAELEARFAEARSYDVLGRHPDAQLIVTPLAAEAKAVGYAPLEAKVILLRAGNEYRTGELATAEHSYREAAEAAARARDDDRIAQSWIDLMNVLAAQGKRDEALELLTVARTAAERVSGSYELGARLANVIAGIYHAQGKVAEAKVEYERALELARKQPGSVILGHALHNMAIALWANGDLPGAKQYFADARVVFLDQAGPHHPMLAYLERNLGDLAIAGNDVDGAIAHYRTAASIWENAGGKDHIDVALAYEPLSWALMRKGDLAGARAAAETALGVRRAKLGKDHPLIAQSLIYLVDIDLADDSATGIERAAERLVEARAIQEARLGPEDIALALTLDRSATIAVRRGQAEAALGFARRGLAIRIKVNGAEHNDTAYSHFLLGEAQRVGKLLTDAGASFDRAATVWEKANGVSDPDVAKARSMQADVRSQQGHHAEALALFDKWIPLGEKAGAPPQQLGGMRLAHARALYRAGKRKAAIAVAIAAREAIATEASATRARGELDAWLAAHPK